MNVTIKAILLAAGFAAALGGAPLIQAATQILDQVVAIVDDDVIMASELRERLATVTENITGRGLELPPEDELVRETLDRLIIESIQMQKAARVGVRVSDAQLNEAVQRIASQNRMSVPEFRDRLEQEGKSYNEMREEIRREIMLQRIQSGNVNQLIQISEQEADNFLATEEGKKLTQEEYRLVHALLPVAPGASDKEVEAARNYVSEALERVRAGEAFDQVISSSQGEHTFSGGDLGWRKRDDLPSLFSDVAPTLEEGETSEVIRSDSGFHLINLQDMRGGKQMVAQTKVRHILVKPSEIKTAEQCQALIEELKSRIVAGEDFADLAREYSDDIGSAQEGGDLGWASSGQMVPEFETEMAKTDIGSISNPVQSQFGWHILEVLDRRDEDVTELAIRRKAMDHLHGRKYQEELDAWLRRIRDEAFVDIK
jgi:peptidyl-prolyl cis-trans isomerase SurA